MWNKLKQPIQREYDEFGHHKTNPSFCAYTWKELTSDIGIDFNKF